VEKIEITEDKTNELIEGFKKLRSTGIAFLIIGVIGPIIAVISTIFGDNFAINLTIPPLAGFIGIGGVFIFQSNTAIKKVMENDFQAFKTKCIRKRLGDYAVVENNEELSKKVKKATKWVAIVGPTKLINADDEIGIVKVDKKLFYAFPL